MQTRECIKCGREKPIGEFPIERRIVGCRHVKCRACAAEDRMLFRKATRKKDGQW